VRSLVDQLRSLSPDASRSEFLTRPAMSQLMALGPAAYPDLREVFLKDSDWAVQASVGYLVITMAHLSDSAVSDRVDSLMNGDNAFVRATVGTLYRSVSPGSFGEVLSKPEVLAIAERLQLHPSIEWMVPADLSKLAANSLSVIEKGRPFAEPPAWETSGGRTTERDVSSIRPAGLRVVTLEHSMAERVFMRISDSLVLSSTDVHMALELILASLELDGGSDPERLGRKFRLTELVLGHQNRDCSDGKCRVYLACKERLFEACDRWVWTATDPNALHAIESALTAIIGLDKAKSLLERLKEHHSNPELREMVGRHLGYYADRLAGELKEREQRKLTEDRIDSEGNTVPLERRGETLPKRQKTVQPPSEGHQHGPESVAVWLGIGAVSLGVGLGGLVFFKSRRSF
jgi:hypothetical protein